MEGDAVIAAFIITDGRVNVLKQTIRSFHDNVGPVSELYLYDDSGQPGTRDLLRNRYPEFELITHPSGERQGFGGAIRTVWQHLRENSTADYIFHLEDDFTFNVEVDLMDLATILTYRPNLAQVAYVRQAWNESEIAAGGVIEVTPDLFQHHTDGHRDWLEHDKFFTTNPSLYRRSLILGHEWPDGLHSEGVFTEELRQAEYRFAYWGKHGDPPVVHHIGAHRYGLGY